MGIQRRQNRIFSAEKPRRKQGGDLKDEYGLVCIWEKCAKQGTTRTVQADLAAFIVHTDSSLWLLSGKSRIKL